MWTVSSSSSLFWLQCEFFREEGKAVRRFCVQVRVIMLGQEWWQIDRERKDHATNKWQNLDSNPGPTVHALFCASVVSWGKKKFVDLGPYNLGKILRRGMTLWYRDIFDQWLAIQMFIGMWTPGVGRLSHLGFPAQSLDLNQRRDGGVPEWEDNQLFQVTVPALAVPSLAHPGKPLGWVPLICTTAMGRHCLSNTLEQHGPLSLSPGGAAQDRGRGPGLGIRSRLSPSTSLWYELRQGA